MNDCGEVIKESNSRMVKWSDGSMSLHLGNEIFDVYKQPLQGDHNHLFIRQGTGLQGQAVFRTKLTFRPHSTESFTHKKMTKTLADRSQKTSGIKILTQVGYDPDADRYSNLKKEEEKLRQAMRAKPAAKPKRSRGDAAAGANSSYQDAEHDSDDEGVISLSAIKNKHKQKYTAGGRDSGKQGTSKWHDSLFSIHSFSNSAFCFLLLLFRTGAAIYSTEEDDSDFEGNRKKKVDKNKALRALADSDEESGSASEHAANSNVDDDVDDKSDSDVWKLPQHFVI